MKIISSFKDYYDGVQSYGMDEKSVFERQSPKVEINLLDGFFDFHKEFIDYGQTYTFEKKGANSYYDERIIATQLLLGFCGMLYFGYKFDTIEKGKPVESRVFYSVEESKVYLKSINQAYNTQGFEIRNHPILTKPNLDWFHTLNAPLFIFPAYAAHPEEVNLNWDEDIPKKPQDLMLNPNLKALDFHKVKDAYSCFQEINQFISGVLSENENKSTTLTDKERVLQHGIDPKYGFRNRPKKKK